MSATRFQQELETERGLLRSICTDTWSRGSRIEYRGHTIEKEPSDDGLSGTWRIRAPDGEFLATVDLNQFGSTSKWIRYVDAVIHSDPAQAAEWFNLPYGEQPKGDGC